MELTIPEKARLKLELLAEAESLSSSLHSFMAQTVPMLGEGDDEDITCFTDHFSSAMDRLHQLSDEVSELHLDDNIAPETEPQCERLRQTVRSNLEKVNLLYSTAREIMEKRRDIYHRSLIEARKKQNLSAYLQSTYAGKTVPRYDRHK